MFRGGATFLFVIINTFSRYVRLYPLKQATAAIIVNSIKQYIESVRKPNTILFDGS